jgi:hypothetical protein
MKLPAIWEDQGVVLWRSVPHAVAMRWLMAVSFSGELRRLAVWLQDAIQALAQGDDRIGMAGKPGLHPHRTLEEGLRRLI